MNDSQRRVGWWALVTVLFIATAAGVGIGGWKSVEAYELTAARSFAAGQNVVNVAKSSAAALLTYTADNASAQLNAAKALTTGAFHDSYSQLVDTTVIPGAQQKHISATAQVAAAGLDSLSETSAVVLVCVNQTVTIGSDSPSTTQPVIRVGMQKVDGVWLINRFDPV